MVRTKKLATISLLIAVGLILHFIESMLPITGFVPGAKIGLANISNLMGLILFGFSGGLQILILRILLGSLLTGTFMTVSFYLSIGGGIFGYLVMAFAYYWLGDKLSIIGISIAGAAFHNFGQIITAFLIISSSAIFYYLPYLLLLSLPTGIGIGLIVYFTINYLPQSLKQQGG